MRRLAAFLVVLALAMPEAAGAQTAQCRVDGVGTTICRDLGAPPAAPRLQRPAAAIPLEAPRQLRVIPRERMDSVGIARPAPPVVAGQRPFGQRPRPTRTIRACTTDSFGGLRCR